MATGQSPKTRGFALEATEKMIWRGLLALVRERDAKQAEINEVGGELNRIIEERIDRPDVLMTGDDVTHRIDPETMQVRPLTDQERMQLGIFQPPAEQPVIDAATTNGHRKIKSHVAADTLALELGITFPEGAKLKQKVALIEEAQKTEPVEA